MGTWIEILYQWYNDHRQHVVPYVGTWIEIEAGAERRGPGGVVPYVGTWIEMICQIGVVVLRISRSLRGNVDRNTGSM